MRANSRSSLRTATTFGFFSPELHLSLLAKQLAGTAVKAGVAVGVGVLTKNEALGALAFLALSVTNQTDLRSWLSLPAEFEVTRFRLPAGDTPVTVTTPLGTTQQTVAIRPKRITLLVLRRY